MGKNPTMKRINRILEEAQREGGFFTSLISTYEGLCLAAVDFNGNNDSIAAIASRIHEIVKQSEKDLGLLNVNEIILRDGNKVQLVEREFCIGEHKFVFAVMAPVNRSFRLIMNRAIKKIVPPLSQFLKGE